MTTIINTSVGEVSINTELFNGYITECATHYAAIDAAKNDLKLIGSALEEATSLKASLVLKYAKAKYDDATKATKELGELFEQLDMATEG